MIVSSLLGYGFSSGPPLDKNLRMEDAMRILDQTTVGLGLTGYLAQGGNVGNFLASMMAAKYSNCQGTVFDTSARHGVREMWEIVVPNRLSVLNKLHFQPRFLRIQENSLR